MPSPRQLILSKQEGRVGITCVDHPTKRQGAVVSELVENSIAHAAGLHVGDHILTINGYDIDGHRDAITRIDEAPDVLAIRIDRLTRQVTLDKRDGRIGITAQNAADGLGCEIMALEAGSIALDAGVSVGETVFAINGILVQSHAHAIDLIDAADEFVDLVLPSDTRVATIRKAGSGRKLGLTVANNWGDESGVVVIGLEKGGLALTELERGDVLLAVDGQLVRDHANAIALVDSNPDTLRLLIGPPVVDLEGLISRTTEYGRSTDIDAIEVSVQPLLERPSNAWR